MFTGNVGILGISHGTKGFEERWKCRSMYLWVGNLGVTFDLQDILGNGI